ncbi:hypothetical protein V0288_08375 [Pannus brasiliensis CCIBt3594]|uniref:Uncharacterized protein n=1 Tax=Pannus brasiliensis CCIBt3594 TaxID=1427578 RepID=A0AAW9QTN9_9CHRO
MQRQAKRENRPFDEENSPRLWIFSPSASLSLLEGFGATVREDWPDGVFFLPPFHRTAIIAINQLPVRPDTLWIRLLGRGNVQDRAVREVLELPGENAFR